MNNKYSLPKDGGLIEVSAPRDIIHRYEKIHTTVYENEYLGVQYVADTIVKAIRTYNEIHCSNEVYEESQPFVLGLTTGRTPLGLYRELVKRHEEGIVSFRNVAVFSLDEFYPIRSTEQQSRNFRIHEDFLNHIDILPENIHIPDGTVPEARISEYCASYDHSVRKIDLMIIGGTSLVVYPAAGLVQYFRGRHLVVVNKGQTGSGVGADLTIDGPIGEIFAQL